jgi:uncharacterized membrane protein
LVEQSIRNRQVIGSSPIVGSILIQLPLVVTLETWLLQSSTTHLRKTAVVAQVFIVSLP